MAKYRILKNSPLTETLIDIRAQISSDTSIEHLEKMYEELKGDFPLKRKRTSFHFELNADGSSNKNTAVNGYLFISEKTKKALQCRLDGFTFSKLKPYESWTALAEETKKRWEDFSSKTKPDLVSRLAVRFINLIEIPLENIELEDYFSNPPQIPKGLPQTLENFSHQMMIGFPNDVKAGIVLANQPTNQKNAIQILFDIEVFKDVAIKPMMSNDMWSIIESLKDRANEVFFESLTEKTIGMFL